MVLCYDCYATAIRPARDFGVVPLHWTNFGTITHLWEGKALRLAALPAKERGSRATVFLQAWSHHVTLSDPIGHVNQSAGEVSGGSLSRPLSGAIAREPP